MMILQVLSTTIAAPLYAVTDDFNQGTVFSGSGREVTITDAGVVRGIPNYIPTFWNMTGSSLAANDLVAADVITDNNGTKRTVAIRKL